MKSPFRFLLIFLGMLLFSPCVYGANTVSYSTHVENIGWQNYVSDGSTAGTTGRALRVEAIKISANNGKDDIEYSTHVENIGWSATRF